MASWCSIGRRSNRRVKRYSCRWPNPAPSTNRRSRRSDSASAHFEEDPLMEPDKTARLNEPGEEPDQHDAKAKVEAKMALEEPRPAGLGARFRQLIEQARQGQ